MEKEEADLIKRLAAVEKKLAKARKDNRLARYNTGAVHKKQMEFHRCPRRNRWVFGGNRTGKTECGAVETVWRARGIHPYRDNKPTSGWVVSLTREVQRDVAQEKILAYLNPAWIADIVMVSGRAGDPTGGVIDYILVKNVFGSLSRIGFKSCEAGREKFQGTSLDYVWFDEEPPESIYDECRMRVFDRKGELFGTMTPLKGLTFAYDKIYLAASADPEIWCSFFEWADNPFLDEGEIAALTASMPANVLESRRYGRFVKNSGLVYGEFDENIHVIEPFDIPPEWQDTMSIDPGLHNPLSCHWYATDGDGTVYVTAEHYAAGKDIDYHAGRIKALCKAAGWKCDKAGRYAALIDPAAGQHTLNAAKSVKELFFERGITVNTSVNKDMFAGINTVKYYLKGELGLPRLRIFSTCVNLIREMKTYSWGGGDSPVKKDDHALDELRYYLMTKPKAKLAPKTKTEVQRDKERLAKKLIRRRC